jgi:hypothetical protein
MHWGIVKKSIDNNYNNKAIYAAFLQSMLMLMHMAIWAISEVTSHLFYGEREVHCTQSEEKILALGNGCQKNTCSRHFKNI